MNRVNAIALRHVFIASASLLIAGNLAAQIVDTPVESGCNGSGAVTVTISDSSGAVVQNAFVLFKADRMGVVPKAKDFLLELHTNPVGIATASVPCGYVDFFAAADGFIPHAEKLLIDKDASSVSLRLEVAKIVDVN